MSVPLNLDQHAVPPFAPGAGLPARRGFRPLAFFSLLARLALGGVLLYAGAIKVPNPGAFAAAISHFDLLPPLGNWAVALILPWVEIVTGFLLISGIWLRSAALAAMLMFLGFGGVVISALARDLDIECGCFGTDAGARVGVEVLVLEFFGLAAGVVVFLFPQSTRELLRFPKAAVQALTDRTLHRSARSLNKK